MIRKAIIVVLALLAMATLAIWVVGVAFQHIQYVDFYDKPSGWTVNPASLTRYSTRPCPSLAVPAEWDYAILGFSWQGVNLGGVFVRTISVPIWFLTIMFSVYPATAFIRGPLRRWRRRRTGLCLKCGYDLTGNESGRCSECGVTL